MTNCSKTTRPITTLLACVAPGEPAVFDPEFAGAEVTDVPLASVVVGSCGDAPEGELLTTPVPETDEIPETEGKTLSVLETSEPEFEADVWASVEVAPSALQMYPPNP